MSNIFNPDAPFMRLLNKISYLMILNFLFIICCIPIITIGPSITALYSAVFKLVTDEEGSIAGDFFNSFKSNFKQSTILGTILLFLGIILIADLLITNLVPIKFAVLFFFTSCLIGVLYIILISYVFPLQCKFENSIKNTLKNALILALSHMFPTTILVTFLNIAPLLLLWFKTNIFINLTPFVLTFMFSSIAFINSKLLLPVFYKYMQNEKQNNCLS